jgi:hypothetical protein
VSIVVDTLAVAQLVARFANSFDLKDWAALTECLHPEVYADYSELRGTSPEVMSRQRFVELRRTAHQHLRTHHLSGNVDIDISGTSGTVTASMVIFRRNGADVRLDTHCMYVFGVEQVEQRWAIKSIVQKVLINEGQPTIHSGIRK